MLIPLISLLTVFGLLVGCAEAPKPPEAAQTGPGSAPLTDADMAYSKGRNAFSKGDFAAAAAAFAAAADLDTANPQHPYHQGIALQIQGLYQEADEAFNRALQRDAGHTFSLVALGKMRYDVQGDIESATSLLEEALQTDSSSVEARYALGLVLAREGRCPEAVPHFKWIAERRPDFEETLTELGMCQLQTADLEGAEKTFKQAIEQRPHDPTPFFGLGQVAMQQGRQPLGQRLMTRSQELQQQADSLKVYGQMVQEHPQAPQAHYNLAVRLSRFGRYGQAESHYRYALQLDSTYVLPYEGLGNLFQRQGKLEEARTYFAQALKRDSTLAEVHNNLGLIHHRQGKLEAAVEAYKTAIRHDPQRSFYYSNLGNAYRDLRQVEAAEAAAHQALELDPELMGARELMGDVQALKGDLEGAIATWRRLAELQPANKPLRVKIQRAEKLLKTGEI